MVFFWLVHLQVLGAEQTLEVLVVEFWEVFWIVDDMSSAIGTTDDRRGVHL